MQIRMLGVAVARVRFVIAAARTERPRPACAAVGLVGDVMRFEKCALRVAVDPVPDRPQSVRVGAGESMAQRHIAVCRDAEQPEPRTAGKGLAHTLVDRGFVRVTVGTAEQNAQCVAALRRVMANGARRPNKPLRAVASDAE